MEKKAEFFEWMDEWAQTRGLNVGIAGEELGDAYDFAGMLRDIVGDRPHGSVTRAMIAAAPTRVLYRRAEGELSEREDAVLKFNRDLVHSESSSMVLIKAGATVARDARDTDGTPIPGLIAVPIINPRVNRQQEMTLDQAVEEVENLLKSKLQEALYADNAIQATGGWVTGDRLRTGG